MLERYLKKLQEKGEVYIRLKARPNAGQTNFTSSLQDEGGETLKIDVAAAPEKGKANQEIIKFLAKEFNLPKANVQLIGGLADKIKLIKIIK
jgi:hypothetical protein